MVPHSLRHGLALLAFLVSPVWAQQPVYLCDGVYTDRPCKQGREVDINPTRGAHSLSGTKKESTEAVMERVSRDIERAQDQGLSQAATMMRCDQLRRKRMDIDATGRAQDLHNERFAIREEQFRLRCKRT